MPRMLKPCTSSDKMLFAFLVLLACELAGDLLRQVLALPVPGPVIGMTILAAALVFKRKAADVQLAGHCQPGADVRGADPSHGTSMRAGRRRSDCRDASVAVGMDADCRRPDRVDAPEPRRHGPRHALEHSPSCCEAIARHRAGPGEGPTLAGPPPVGAIDHLWNASSFPSCWRDSRRSLTHRFRRWALYMP